MAKMVSLQCDGCGKFFERNASQQRGNIKRGRIIVACSNKCVGRVREALLIGRWIDCMECGRQVKAKDKDQKFCSRLCWGRSRKRLTKIKEPTVKKIRAIGDRGEDYSVTTLGDLRGRYVLGQFHAKLRGLARIIYKNSQKLMQCYNCGYNLHVDICHIRPVADFPSDTPVAVVNSIENLVALDKRCHWEFDHGYLELG